MTEFLADYQHRANQFLSGRLDQLSDLEPRLKSAMRHALLLGGKRMRPALVYITGEMLGAHSQDLDVAAAAVECIHAFSLVHDDLPAMDDDDLRRGQPTCHIQFDEATAILAGDSLQALAFEILSCDALSQTAEPQRLKLLQILSRNTGYNGMCGGQSVDISLTDKAANIEQLQILHAHKTGALIEAAVLMGAHCAGQIAPSELENLQKYARAIGLAFQVYDDILDVTGDTQTLGKPSGSDISHNKSTYPALLGLEGAQKKAQQLMTEALQALQALPYNSGKLEQLARFVVNRTH